MRGYIKLKIFLINMFCTSLKKGIHCGGAYCGESRDMLVDSATQLSARYHLLPKLVVTSSFFQYFTAFIHQRPWENTGTVSFRHNCCKDPNATRIVECQKTAEYVNLRKFLDGVEPTMTSNPNNPYIDFRPVINVKTEVNTESKSTSSR